MRALLVVAVLGVSTLAAQTAPVVRSGPTMQAPSNGLRFGNILFPGGIAPHQQTHAGRIGAVVGGGPFPGAGVGGGGRPGLPNRNRTIVVPYAVPVYYGDPYGYGYGYQQQTPNVTVVVPQQSTPSVVINHNYSPETARPVLRDYSNSELPESGIKVYEGPRQQSAAPAEPAQPETRRAAPDKPTIYLIALKDGTIRQAIGYWIEGSSLNYVTPQSSINNVALDSVDRELSVQLNSERNLEFDLNSARR